MRNNDKFRNFENESMFIENTSTIRMDDIEINYSYLLLLLYYYIFAMDFRIFWKLNFKKKI